MRCAARSRLTRSTHPWSSSKHLSSKLPPMRPAPPQLWRVSPTGAERDGCDGQDPTQLRAAAGGESEAELEGATVREVLDSLYERYDGLSERLADESGSL